jgi:hypothetical protein
MPEAVPNIANIVRHMLDARNTRVVYSLLGRITVTFI